MKEIPLTRGYVALVDDGDWEDLSQYNWRVHLNRQMVYATRDTKAGDGRWTTVRMHRQILDAPAGVEVDHIDGDGLNCQRENIRLCTGTENKQNTRKRRGASSQFKGVCWRKRRHVWRAYAKTGASRLYLGDFAIEADAARAYDAAAREHFGEFAAVNFPGAGERGCVT